MKRNAKWYKDVLDAIPDFVLVKGARSKLLWANKAFRDYYGMSNEELEDIVDAPHSDPDDTIQYVRDDHHVFSTGEVIDVVEPVTDSKGDIGYFNTLKSPVRNENGVIEATIGVSRKIKDQKFHLNQKADRTKNKEDLTLLKSFASSLPVAVVMLDQKKRIVSVSDEWTLKIDPNGKRNEGLFFDDCYPDFQKISNKIVELNTETDNLLLDSFSIKESDLIIRPMLKSWKLSDGSIIGTIIFFEDITFSLEERKKADSNLKKANQRLEIALKASSIGIWGWNLETNTLSWDEQMYRLYGVEKRNLSEPYETWVNGLHPDDKEESEKILEEVLNNEGKKFDTTFRVVHPSGHVRTIRAFAAVNRNTEGKPIEMIGANYDITEEKLNQEKLKAAIIEAKQALVTKSAFLANMSHEIRTPLNGIIGMTELIKDDIKDKKLLESLNVISESGDILLSIINDILDLSKIEAGMFKAESVVFNPNEMLRETLGLMLPKAEDAGLEIELNHSSLPKYLSGDVLRIKQILINLIGNAIKFTEKGRVEVNVSIEKLSESQKNSVKLMISVSDTGIGFDSGITSSLFDAFKQADTTTTRRYGGTGLGLSICRQLVKGLNGNISAVSEIGKGSTFKFEIPLKVITNFVEKTDEKSIHTHYSDFSSLKILVAEDNKINQIVINRMLEKLGCECINVENGLMVLDKIAEEKFDLIIMDCHMPKMDGYEATVEVKKILNPPRVIALTASAMKEDLSRCTEAGMDGIMVKPIELDVLREELQITFEQNNSKKNL